ncbi:MAG TPA: hypothetical protein DEB39_11225 [Planctomycetaceae bacterium]|nr:hypothetical protein [Planctomycetaceae bacterium]
MSLYKQKLKASECGRHASRNKQFHRVSGIFRQSSRGAGVIAVATVPHRRVFLSHREKGKFLPGTAY